MSIHYLESELQPLKVTSIKSFEFCLKVMLNIFVKGKASNFYYMQNTSQQNMCLKFVHKIVKFKCIKYL